MRRGHATRAMRLMFLLVLLLLLAASCAGDATTTAAGTTKSASAGTAATVKTSPAHSGSTVSSTEKLTTSKTLVSTIRMTTAKSVPFPTTKETQQSTLVATTKESTTLAPKETSMKPTSSSVSGKMTGVMSTTAASKPPAVTVPPPSTLASSKAASPPILPSIDSSDKVTTRPSLSSLSKTTLSAVVPKVPTSPGATTSHRHTTAPGSGSGVVPVGSATTTKEKTTAPPTVSAVPATARPGHTTAKGAVATTTAATKHEGKTDSATTQAPLGTPPPTPDSSHTAAGTTHVPTHPPSPASGTIQAPFQAQTKIVCKEAVSSKYPGIVLTFNDSTPCSDLESSPLKEPLMHELCRAVKPSFNRSRDDCTGSLASIADDPKKLAVLRVSVTTHSVDDELSESLVVKKGELEKVSWEEATTPNESPIHGIPTGDLQQLGLTNLTYAGKPLDLDTEDRFGLPLIITIVCMAASLLLVAAIYGCCHQRISRRKDQQRLTEELQTMENGYHDNPTLEVMETSAEMQEKKVNLNGELADSWIVPMDSLTKEDLEEEEDTHL